MILVFFCAIINKRKFRTSIYLLPEKKKLITFMHHNLPKYDCLSKDKIEKLRFSNQQYGVLVVYCCMSTKLPI